jgi:hypothetical protein
VCWLLLRKLSWGRRRVLQISVCCTSVCSVGVTWFGFGGDLLACLLWRSPRSDSAVLLRRSVGSIWWLPFFGSIVLRRCSSSLSCRSPGFCCPTCRCCSSRMCWSPSTQVFPPSPQLSPPSPQISPLLLLHQLRQRLPQFFSPPQVSPLLLLPSEVMLKCRSPKAGVVRGGSTKVWTGGLQCDPIKQVPMLSCKGTTNVNGMDMRKRRSRMLLLFGVRSMFYSACLA